MSGAAKRRQEGDAPPSDMPIPDQLNIAIIAVTFSAAIGLLWLGSWVDQSIAVLAVGVLYSYVYSQ